MMTKEKKSTINVQGTTITVLSRIIGACFWGRQRHLLVPA